jgi:hypothetical protein
LQERIHFNGEPYQMNSTFSSSNYGLTIDLDLQGIAKVFERLRDTFSYLPIKQLTIQSEEEPSISELMKIPIQLPHVTFLSVEPEHCPIFDTNQSRNINEDDRFNNIDRLQLSTKITRQWITCLRKYLTNVKEVYIIKSESESESESESDSESES